MQSMTCPRRREHSDETELKELLNGRNNFWLFDCYYRKWINIFVELNRTNYQSLKNDAVNFKGLKSQDGAF